MEEKAIMEKEKRGFSRIGYLANFVDIPKQLKNLAGITYYDYKEFDRNIDKQWDEKNILCYDKDFAELLVDSDDISYFLLNTGLKKVNSDDYLYARFQRKDGSTSTLDEPGWEGVVFGTKAELLNKSTCNDTNSALHPFERYTSLNSYTSILRILCDITGCDFTMDECQSLIKDSFCEAEKNDSLAIFPDNDGKNKKISFFPIKNCLSTNGTQLFIKMEHHNTSTMKKWFGAFVSTRDELLDELLSLSIFHIGYFIFDSLNKANSFFDHLANKAMKENWKWANNRDSNYSQPILKSYLEFTYYRLRDEDAQAMKEKKEKKKKIFEYNGKEYFNSGLLDRNFRQIIIVGDIYKHKVTIPSLGEEDTEWNLLKNIWAYSHNEPEIARMFHEDELPEIASYFEDYRKVVFDAQLDIHLNDDHIFVEGVERGRLPKYQKEYNTVKDNNEEKDLLIGRIARDFDSARDRAKLMAERNYKIAVPQFWKETGELQFLLPIYLGEREEAEKPQCALVLSKDNSGRVPYYRGETILTLDMAYNNTRLIAKPDVFWLNDLVQRVKG